MRESAKYETAKKETMEMYEHCHRVVLQDCNLLYASTDEHFKKISQGLQQWLNTWIPILFLSIQEGMQTGTNQMHDI